MGLTGPSNQCLADRPQFDHDGSYRGGIATVYKPVTVPGGLDSRRFRRCSSDRYLLHWGLAHSQLVETEQIEVSAWLTLFFPSI